MATEPSLAALLLVENLSHVLAFGLLPRAAPSGGMKPQRSGLPIQRISEVSAIIGPTMDTSGWASNWVDGLNIVLIVLPANSDGPLHRWNDTKSQKMT